MRSISPANPAELIKYLKVMQEVHQKCLFNVRHIPSCQNVFTVKREHICMFVCVNSAAYALHKLDKMTIEIQFKKLKTSILLYDHFYNE